jgi:initiation factor 1A
MYQSIISSGKKRNYRNSRKNTDLVEPDEDQRFAVVKELLGNGRLNALCDDCVVRMGRIRGAIRSGPRKVIISRGDLIIVSNRDFEDKVDVVHRYTHDEATLMFRRYKLPDILVRSWNMEIGDNGDKSSDAIEFVESDDEQLSAVNVDSI